MTEPKQLTQLVIENSHDAIAVFDQDMRYSVWNPAMERLTGLLARQVIGRTALEVFPHLRESGGYEINEQALAGETVSHAERRFQVPATGRQGFCDVMVSPLRSDAGNVVGAFAIVRDVTERRGLEDQLRQSQKMEAIGQLAGGVAHDFNNLLTAISGFNELLAQRVDDEVALQYAGEVAKATEQAASLVRQLLAFARREMVEPRELDLNMRIAESEQMLRRLIGETVRLTVRASSASAWVVADPAEIEQILLNLAVNARDAMPSGGLLEIATSVEDREVVLSVSDTGVGMDEETLAHVLEPFFTTKPVGYGTGLGLTTVFAIVERSAGRIAIESEPGKGTIVVIRLPRIEPSIASAEPEPSVTTFDTGTILLVEDADSVRAVTRAILESAGYTVVEASDGTAALDLIRHRSRPADLVLTDVVMPGLGGYELAEWVWDEWPGTPVVLMTGYWEEPDRHRDEHGTRLCKPFTREELLARVSEELAVHSPTRRLRCLIADDHPSVCVALREALRARGIDTVAEARDGRTALAAIEATRPQVAVVDARMPEIDGIELARRAADASPETRVIVYSGFADRTLVDSALDAGAAGFVLKGAPLAELVQAVEAVAAGKTHVDPQIASIPGPGKSGTLTPRESEVLRLAADGLTNLDIAAQLHISSDTVQTHVRRAMSKLDAESRTQAVAKALRQELIA